MEKGGWTFLLRHLVLTTFFSIWFPSPSPTAAFRLPPFMPPCNPWEVTISEERGRPLFRRLLGSRKAGECRLSVSRQFSCRDVGDGDGETHLSAPSSVPALENGFRGFEPQGEVYADEVEGFPPLETFLREYWQKKPLIVRNAFPEFNSPLTGNTIAGLATKTGVESRLMRSLPGPSFKKVLEQYERAGVFSLSEEDKQKHPGLTALEDEKEDSAEGLGGEDLTADSEGEGQNGVGGDRCGNRGEEKPLRHHDEGGIGERVYTPETHAQTEMTTHVWNGPFPVRLLRSLPDPHVPLEASSASGSNEHLDSQAHCPSGEKDEETNTRESAPAELSLRDLEENTDGSYALIVNEANRHVESLDGLMETFRSLVPSWRLEDVMASYAVRGGGVGPHLDEFDVFILQASGERVWSLENRFVGREEEEERLVKGLNCRRFASLETPFEDMRKGVSRFRMQKGDLIYIPPRVPHEGVALDNDCVNLSFGFLAPSQERLCEGVMGGLLLPESRPHRDMSPASGGGEEEGTDAPAGRRKRRRRKDNFFFYDHRDPAFPFFPLPQEEPESRKERQNSSDHRGDPLDEEGLHGSEEERRRKVEGEVRSKTWSDRGTGMISRGARREMREMFLSRLLEDMEADGGEFDRLLGCFLTLPRPHEKGNNETETIPSAPSGGRSDEIADKRAAHIEIPGAADLSDWISGRQTTTNRKDHQQGGRVSGSREGFGAVDHGVQREGLGPVGFCGDLSADGVDLMDDLSLVWAPAVKFAFIVPEGVSGVQERGSVNMREREEITEVMGRGVETELESASDELQRALLFVDGQSFALSPVAGAALFPLLCEGRSLGPVGRLRRRVDARLKEMMRESAGADEDGQVKQLATARGGCSNLLRCLLEEGWLRVRHQSLTSTSRQQRGSSLYGGQSIEKKSLSSSGRRRGRRPGGLYGKRLKWIERGLERS